MGRCASATRRQVLSVLGAGAASLALWPGRLWVSASGTRVRLAVRPRSFSALPFWSAVEGKFLEDAGLAPELHEVEDESAAALALIRDEADVAVLPTPLFLAVHLGTSGLALEPHPLATFQVALTDGSTLVVREGGGIEFSRQLDGKTIGVTTPWGMPRLLADIYLLQSGLKPGEDTRWEVVTPGEAAEALHSGRVDALAAEEWLPAELVARGEARTMVSLRRLWQDHPAEVVAVSRRFAEAQPDVLARLAGATLRGAKALEGFGEEASEAAWAKWAGAGAALAARAYRESGAGDFPFPFHSGLRIILEEMKKRRLTPLNLDYGEVVASLALTGLCREAMGRAGFPEIPGEDSRDERMMGCCYTI